MATGSDLALAIALPVGIVALIVLILVSSWWMARQRRRQEGARTEPKSAAHWNEDRDEELEDREWLPLEAGWRDPSQSRLSSMSFQSISSNGFAYRPPPPPAAPPPIKTMTPMTERKKSGISSVNVPATIGERDEPVARTATVS